jgi:hypothetical protein
VHLASSSPQRHQPVPESTQPAPLASTQILEEADQIRLDGGTPYTLAGWVRTVQGGPLVALTAPDATMRADETVFTKPPADGGVASVLYVVRRQLRLLHRTEEGAEALQLTTELPGAGVADGAWHHFIVTCV